MINRLFDEGLRQLFGGARRGRPVMTGFGTALALFAWLRQRRAPAKERLWATNLSEGESVQITFRRGEPDIEEAGEGA
jgi:hypothetical protein